MNERDAPELIVVGWQMRDFRDQDWFTVSKQVYENGVRYEKEYPHTGRKSMYREIYVKRGLA
jgi:hypothetical protein